MTNITNKAEVKDILDKVEVSRILSVYSGKPGCMCGCLGKHTYNPAHVAEASKSRGYSVTEDEVNQASIKRVLNAMKKKLVDSGDVSAFYNGGVFAVETPIRQYALYITKAAS